MPLTARGRASVALATASALGPLLVWAPLQTSSLERWQLPKELVFEACALLAIAVAPPRTRWTLLDGATIAVVTVAIASAAMALVPWIGARHAAITLAGVALASVLREVDPKTRERARDVILVGLGVVALVALAETFGIVRGLSGHGRAPGATLGQRNAVAHVLAIGAPFAWRMTSQSGRSVAARVMGGGVLALSVAAIVATRSRAGWLALGLVVIVMLALAVRERALGRNLVIATWVLGSIVLVVLPRPALTWSRPRPYEDTLGRLLEADAGSGRGRLVQIEASLVLVRDAPWLGVGPGNWRVAYPRVSPPDDPTFERHAIDPVGRLLTSDVASVPIERGLIGALFAGLALFALVRELLRTEDASLRAASLACVGALVPLTLFDTLLEVAPPVAVLAVLLTPTVPKDGHAMPRFASIAPPLMAALLLGGAVAHRSAETWSRVISSDPGAGTDALARAAAIDPGDFEVRMRLARALALRGDCSAAMPWLREAVRLRPHDALPREERDACRDAGP